MVRGEEVEPNRAPLAGLAWMVLAQVAFAAMNLLARLAAPHAAWAEVALGRNLVGASVAIGVALARGAPLRVKRQRAAFARSIAGTCALLCTFYVLGAPAVALGDVVTLGSTSPIFIALLAPYLLGERSGGRVIGPIVLAFLGAAIVVGPHFTAAGNVAVVALLAAVFSAFAMISLRRLGGEHGAPREGAEAVAIHFSLFASAVTGLLAARSWTLPTPTGLALIAATGLAGGFAQLAMTRAYALEKAARVSAVGYVGVVLTHLFAAALLGERPSMAQVGGAILVVTAGLWLALGAVSDGRAPAPPVSVTE